MAYKSLKLWFDEALAIRLADNILSIKSDFNKDQFVTNCNKELSHLELKDRVKLFARQIC